MTSWLQSFFPLFSVVSILMLFAAPASAYNNSVECIEKLFPHSVNYDQIPPEIWRYCQAKWDSTPIIEFSKNRKSAGIDTPDLFSGIEKYLISKLYTMLDNDANSRNILDFDRLFKFGAIALYVMPNMDAGDKNNLALMLPALNKIKEQIKEDTILSKRKGINTQIVLSFNPYTLLVTNELYDITLKDLLLSDFIRHNYLSITRYMSLPTNYSFVATYDEIKSLYFLSFYISLMKSEQRKLKKYWGLTDDKGKDRIFLIYIGDKFLELSSCKLPIDVTAMYCAGDDAVFVRSGADKEPAAATPFRFMSAQVFHEIAHGFLNPPNDKERAFLSEAMATARGERMLRVLIAAEEAIKSKEKDLAVEGKNRFLFIQMNTVQMTGKEIKLFCNFIKNSYSGNDLYRYMTLSYNNFNLLPGDELDKAYSIAFSV